MTTCKKCNLEIEDADEQVFYSGKHYHRNCFLQLFNHKEYHSVMFGPMPVPTEGKGFLLIRPLKLPVSLDNYDPAKDRMHQISLSTTDLELICHTIQNNVETDHKLQRLYGRLQMKLSESNEFARCQRKECPNHKKLVRRDEMVEGDISRQIILDLAQFMPHYKSKSKVRKVMLFCSVECDTLYSKKAEAIKIQLQTVVEEQEKELKKQPSKTQPGATASEIAERNTKKKQAESEQKKIEDAYLVCCVCKKKHETFQCDECEKPVGIGHCAEKHNVSHYDQEQLKLREEEVEAEGHIMEIATDYALIEKQFELLTVRKLRKMWYASKNGDEYHVWEGKRVPLQDWRDMIQDVISVKLEERGK